MESGSTNVKTVRLREFMVEWHWRIVNVINVMEKKWGYEVQVEVWKALVLFDIFVQVGF